MSDGEFIDSETITIEVAISLPSVPEDIPDDEISPYPASAGGSPERICFSWPEAQYAESYDLIVARDREFSLVVLEVRGLTEPHYCIGDPAPYISGEGLEPFQVYYWRVIVHNRHGEATYPETGFATGASEEGGEGEGEPSACITLYSPPFVPYADVVYQMISVPLYPEDPRPLAVLGDDLGPYYRFAWRLFHYESSDGQYHEFPDVPDMTPGIAFWIVANDRVEIDAHGWPVGTESDFVVRIPPGFFQLGCPFYFPVSWSEVKVRKGEVTVLVGDPANEWINPILYKYEFGSYVPSNILEPWKGYWVENVSDEEVELLIPPRVAVE